MDVALEKLEFTGDLREEELGDTVSQRAEVGAGLTQVLGRWQRVLFVRLSNETTTEARRYARTPPSMYSRASATRRCRATSSAASVRPYCLYCELRGSPTRSARTPRSCSCACKASASSISRERGICNLRAELGAPSSSRRRRSRSAGLATLLRRRRPQRARLRAQRAVAARRSKASTHRRHATSPPARSRSCATCRATSASPRSTTSATPSTISAIPDFEYSVGLGVRYSIAVASFGVDVAQALSESGRNPRFHLYISTQF